MIAFAENTQKQDIIHIWKTSFPNDSPEFIEMYFTKKYAAKNTLVSILDNKIVSCLQMLPYTIHFYNQLCKLSYISGAATLPDYQNRGIMGKLLSQSFTEMKNRGDVFTTLIPQEAWLIEFYKKYGYATCFEYSLTPISLENDCFSDSFSVLELEGTHLREAYEYYYRHCRQQNLVVLKSFDDFLVIWEELTMFSGSVLVGYESENMCGICFCSPSSEKVIIKDLITDSETARKQLVSLVRQKYHTENIYLYEPASDNKEPIALGMARIIHAEKALQIYASYYPLLQITVKVQDNQMAENNGIFCLANGICTQTHNHLVDIEVDINLLSQLLFGYQTSHYAHFPQQHPYMSLMLE